MRCFPTLRVQAGSFRCCFEPLGRNWKDCQPLPHESLKCLFCSSSPLILLGRSWQSLWRVPQLQPTPLASLTLAKPQLCETGIHPVDGHKKGGDCHAIRDAWKAASRIWPGASKVTISWRWLRPLIRARLRKTCCRCAPSASKYQVQRQAFSVSWQTRRIKSIMPGWQPWQACDTKMWRGNDRPRFSCTTTPGGVRRNSGVQRTAPVIAATHRMRPPGADGFTVTQTWATALFWTASVVPDEA